MFRAAPIAPWLGLIALVGAALGCAPDPSSVDENAGTRAVHAQYDADLAELVRATTALDSAARQATGPDSAALQRTFSEARTAYKRVEYLIEYYDPRVAIGLNGPPVDDIEWDEDPPTVMHAQGFQVLEPLLFPMVDKASIAAIRAEAVAIRDCAERAQLDARAQVVREEGIFDAARFEIARVITLGVTGFDSPIRHASIPEARAALDGLRAGMAAYARLSGANWLATVALDSALAHASMALHGEFDAFDRLAFIVDQASPLARAIVALRDASHVRPASDVRLWRTAATTPFESGAFDAAAVRPSWPESPNAALTSLGERLFTEPALSGTGTRSCASCHQLSRAFTDGLATSASLVPGATLRNAPTLINAGLQREQFADLRAHFLEEQIAAVVTSPKEMNGTLELAANRLRADPAYVRAFAAAIPARADSAVTGSAIRAALGAYIRSLVRLDSRVDSALRGSVGALSEDERLGFNLFSGKAACATCHFLPLTNGTAPPAFVETESEVIGVPRSPEWRHATIDRDSGRIGVTRTPRDRFAFKTPTLRNVALTAPYMHNGVYRTLEEVVRFYDGGGGAGIGIRIPNQTLSTDSLHLSAREQHALVQFMQALTDTSATSSRSRR